MNKRAQAKLQRLAGMCKWKRTRRALYWEKKGDDDSGKRTGMVWGGFFVHHEPETAVGVNPHRRWHLTHVKANRLVACYATEIDAKAAALQFRDHKMARDMSLAELHELLDAPKGGMRGIWAKISKNAYVDV